MPIDAETRAFLRQLQATVAKHEKRIRKLEKLAKEGETKKQEPTKKKKVLYA